MRWFSRQKQQGSKRLALQWRANGLAWACEAKGQITGAGLHPVEADLGKALAEVVGQQGCSGCAATLLLGSGSYQILQVPSPSESGAEPPVFRDQIKDLLDYSVNDAAIGGFVLPEDAFRGRQRMSYIVAAPKAPLRSIAEMIIDADLQLDRIEVPELAVNGLLANLAKDGPGAGLVFVDGEHGWVSLHQGSNLYLIRNVDITHEGMAQSSPLDHSNMLDSLVLELQRSMDYYDSQLGKGVIRSLWLAPGLDWSEKISGYLHENLRIPVVEIKADAFSGGQNASDNSACFIVQAALLAGAELLQAGDVAA